MKKMLFFAATFLAAGFISCSNEADNELNSMENEDRVPVFLSVSGNNATVSTRGTGAVGAVAGDANKWNGETLNVYMFDKGEDTLALAKDPSIDNFVFNNEVITTPTGAATGYATISEPKFYPMVGNFDFFAYRADDAASVLEDGGIAVPEKSLDKMQMILPVTIDGSQDLMVAKADMPVAQRDKFVEVVGSEKANRYYSAFSARKKIGIDGLESQYGIQPHFKFNHLLSRLVFSVKPSKRDVSDANVSGENYLGVSIDSIKIVDVNTSADFIVAWKGSIAENLINYGTVGNILLKQKGTSNLENLAPFKPQWDSESDQPKTTRVGESILLFPAANYKLQVHLSQMPRVGAATNKFVHEQVLNTPTSTPFLAGTQYNITFTVYGLEEIMLEVELTPWEEGGDIAVDNDEM